MRVCDGESIRCLVVKGRFLVYYIYYPPSASYPAGVQSIRAIKHSAMEDPAAGGSGAQGGDLRCDCVRQANPSPPLAPREIQLTLGGSVCLRPALRKAPSRAVAL